MNREWVLFNLREAADELSRTISEIETTREYDHADLSVAMQHLYHHVNTAWNARDASAERVNACSEEDFNAWRQFPNDMEIV
jgi:hypothetical protein